MYLGIFLLLAAIMIMTLLLMDNQNTLDRSHESRYRSYLAADELRQSSDDLTRLARTYVVSGSPMYEEMYWEILAIRNGESPRPNDYHRIYWDLVLDMNDRPRPFGEQNALQNRMEALGFTAEEFALLAESQANSDALVFTETIAMNAVKGLFDDGQGNFVVEAPPDREMAIRIMHDAAYHREKAGIMAPIDRFLEILQARTQSEVDELSARAELYTTIIVVLSGMLALLLLLSYLLFRIRVMAPIMELDRSLQSISGAEGDLSTRLPIRHQDELGSLATSYNATAQRIGATLSGVREQAHALTELGTNLSSNMTQAASAVNQITANIQGVNQQSGSQHESVTSSGESMRAIVAALEQLDSLIEQQTLHVSESSSAVEQMIANIASITKSLQSNEHSVQELRDTVEHGRSDMDTVMKDVSEVENQSEGLIEISRLIQQIAAQTNLLAMNAAIEAAHAGDKGRGFAVVADEVRKLAESAGAHAHTISVMLKSVRESVERITDSAGRVQSRFAGIETSIQQVSQQETSIRSAMEEQSAGSKQVLNASEEVAQATNEVQTHSHEMLKRSQEVKSVFETLDRISDEITSSMNEMTIGMQEISSSVNAVNDLSAENREVITALVQEIDRFRL
ncbi:MAG: methyl-accepting chemotaxis protein [Spirochaetaceae bacterium]|nr:MAG: methyl-accepting chemotaxis protein [Spirochaetaceae bacterium]